MTRPLLSKKASRLPLAGALLALSPLALAQYPQASKSGGWKGGVYAGGRLTSIQDASKVVIPASKVPAKVPDGQGGTVDRVIDVPRTEIDLGYDVLATTVHGGYGWTKGRLTLGAEGGLAANVATDLDITGGIFLSAGGRVEYAFSSLVGIHAVAGYAQAELDYRLTDQEITRIAAPIATGIGTAQALRDPRTPASGPGREAAIKQAVETATLLAVAGVTGARTGTVDFGGAYYGLGLDFDFGQGIGMLLEASSFNSLGAFSLGVEYSF